MNSRLSVATRAIARSQFVVSMPARLPVSRRAAPLAGYDAARGWWGRLFNWMKA